jgi:hypothetical protein
MAAYLMAKFLKFPTRTVETNKLSYHILSYTLVLLLIGTSIFTGYHVIRENNFTKSANRFIKKNQSIGKTYIYDSSVDVSRTPYQLELRLAGESLADETREMILRDAEHFGIMRQQIVIHEDATVRFDQLNETEIVRDLISSNATNIQVRDDSIKALQAELAYYKAQQLPATQLAAELQTQIPTITRIALTKGTSLENEMVTSESQVVVVVYCSAAPTEEEKARVQEWLQVRLQTKDVEMIFM